MFQLRPLSASCFMGFVMAGFVVEVTGNEAGEFDQRIEFSGDYSRGKIDLEAGQTVEISAGVQSPSKLPINGRLAAEWSGPAADAGFRKVLHALDPDVYVVYRVPQKGRYTLSLRAVDDEESAASAPRWRETGVLARTKSFPAETPWPAGHQVLVRVTVRVTNFGPATRGGSRRDGAEQFDRPGAAAAAGGRRRRPDVRVTGGADDIEYFDNDQYGESGDDWFRLEYPRAGSRGC